MLLENISFKMIPFKVITIPFIQPSCSPSHCIIIDSYLVIGLFFLGILLGIDLGRNRDKIMAYLRRLIK